MELVLPGKLFHLKRLKVRLMFTLGSGEGNTFVKKLIQAAPRLEEFTIHYGANTILNTKEFLKILPEMLTDFPPRRKVGLRDRSINDSLKDTMESLRMSNIKLFSVHCELRRTSYAGSRNISEVLGLDSQFASQKITAEGSHLSRRHIARASTDSFRQLQKVEHCWSKPLFQMGHFIFPNLNHLTLSSVGSDFTALNLLSTACPQIQRLSCELKYSNTWEVLTRLSPQQALELVLGVRTPENSGLFPLQGLKG